MWLSLHTVGAFLFLTIASSQTEWDRSAKITDAMAFAYTVVAVGVAAWLSISFKLDPGGDGQAALALAFVPIFAGGLGLAAAALGFVIQLVRSPD